MDRVPLALSISETFGQNRFANQGSKAELLLRVGTISNAPALNGRPAALGVVWRVMWRRGVGQRANPPAGSNVNLISGLTATHLRASGTRWQRRLSYPIGRVFLPRR